MSLLLDARQRAMLEEMGVKVWLPAAAAAQPARLVAEAPEPAAGPTDVAESTRRGDAAPPNATRTAGSAAAPPPMRPAAPSASRSAHAPVAAGLRIAPPVALYDSEGRAARGGWLVVADMPPGADGRHGAPLAGDAGRLLDQMLRALHLHTAAAPVHLVRAHRASPGAPTPEGDADFDSAFEGWAAPLAPRIVLAMGPLSAQRLLGRTDPLGRLRGQPQPLPALGGATQIIATYPPSYLLRNGADKARAWADLCLAAECFERGAG